MTFAHLGPNGVPAPFAWRELLEGWSLEVPLVVGMIWLLIVYLVCWFRGGAARQAKLQTWRTWAFLAGLVGFGFAVNGPLDRYGDVNMAIHMVQHMFLLYVVAPLLVLGAPLSVVYYGLDPAFRRSRVDPIVRLRLVSALTNPWMVALVYVGALYGTHFTGWYEAALENAMVHRLEHLTYVITGVLLWTVLVGHDGAPVRRSGAQRIGVVLALVPAMTIVAVIFIVAPTPLYPWYVSQPAPWGGAIAARASQQAAGGVMWVPSMFVTLGLLAWTIYDWYRIDEAADRERETSDVNTRERTSGFDLERQLEQCRLVTPAGTEMHRSGQTSLVKSGR